jgi:hypothetical protein
MTENNDPPSITPRPTARSNQTPRLSETARSNQTPRLSETARSGQTTRLSQTARAGQTNSKRSTKYNFRVQSAPPLSIQQFLRSATGVIAGGKQWQTSGKYREPIFRAYLSPAVRTKPKPVEPVWHAPSRYKEKPPTSLSPEKRPQKKIVVPVWHAPGQYKEKPPTSLSPEKRPQKKIVLPVWHHPGKVEQKPVSYFDPPSLRWSVPGLLRSMPDMRPKTFKATRSMSAVRKSEEI